MRTLVDVVSKNGTLLLKVGPKADGTIGPEDTAVLKAIGGDLSGDEFEQMERLAELTKLPIPSGLRGLRERPVLHRDVIDPGEIVDYVRRQLG